MRFKYNKCECTIIAPLSTWQGRINRINDSSLIIYIFNRFDTAVMIRCKAGAAIIFNTNSNIKLIPAQPIIRKYITVLPSDTKFADSVSLIVSAPRIKNPVFTIGASPRCV